MPNNEYSFKFPGGESIEFLPYKGFHRHILYHGKGKKNYEIGTAKGIRNYDGSYSWWAFLDHWYEELGPYKTEKLALYAVCKLKNYIISPQQKRIYLAEGLI